MRILVLVAFALQLALPGLHALVHEHEHAVAHDHAHAHTCCSGHEPQRDEEGARAGEAHAPCPICEHLAKSKAPGSVESDRASVVFADGLRTPAILYAAPFADAVHFVGDARAPPVRA